MSLVERSLPVSNLDSNQEKFKSIILSDLGVHSPCPLLLFFY